MQSDLTYFLWMHLAALAVATTTLGVAAWVHFSEERWGRRPSHPPDTDDVHAADVSVTAPAHEHDRAA